MSGKGPENYLRDRALSEIGKLRRVRRPRTTDIFERIAYIFPDELRVVNYYRKPVASFNPGALIDRDRVLVFPRLVFDYHSYVSGIGLVKLEAEQLLRGTIEKPLNAELILWPRELWEFRGCEDARLHRADGRTLLLYTGFGYHDEGGVFDLKWVQGLATLAENLSPVERKFFKIAHGETETVPKMKDSAFLSIKGDEASLLLRPSLGDIEICWSGRGILSEAVIDASSMKPVLVQEDWEFKVGWSTNTVAMSSNEFLVGWHGVLKSDYSYREGLALLSSEGDLLAISDYVLAPRGVIEEFGDRPHVVFGCGLLVYREKLIWVGGVSDYAIGVFATDLDRALDELHWLRG